MQNWAKPLITAAALTAALTCLPSCQKADKNQKADPDQELMDRTKKTLGGVYEIINDLNVDCATADGRLNVYAKDHALDFKWIEEKQGELQKDSTPRAKEMEQNIARLVGNNTPAFRRFAKRCPAQTKTLERTLDKLGGAMAKKLGLNAPSEPAPAASRPPSPPSEATPTHGAPGADGEVRPPVAADLEGYLKGLEGNGKKLAADIETTMGTIHCELFPDKAPMTVANFVGLARGLKPFLNPKTGKVEKRPFYDGIIFHRVIPNFMLQTGDPLGQGTGGPGYRFADEFTPTLRFDRPGRMAMANAGPKTNGSQFFITEKPTQHLNDKHSIFGQCEDLDLIKKIARVPKNPRNNSRPATDVVIKHIKIYRGK